MGKATQFLHVNKPFQFRKGGILSEFSLAYETWGELNRERSNAVMILTGISPSAHAASNQLDDTDGWWEPMIGPGKPIDTRRNFVICINSLGSCMGSTGPSSHNPETDKAYRLSFPDITIWDIAASAQRVLDHLGIEQLRMAVGPSMGGMSCIAWSYLNPKRSRHFLGVSSSPHAEPFSIAIRSLQREAIVTDPNWHNGNYTNKSWPKIGMRIARKLGMITYRSAEEWVQRFGRERSTDHARIEDQFVAEFSVESYLENVARKFTGTFDPNCYLFLSHASDLFDLAEYGGSLASGFKRLQLERTLVIGVRTDILFPIDQQRELAEGISAVCKDTQLAELDCIRGHDSFLVDMDAFRPVICDFLA
jgi:homoserine O-acetyltransferase